MTQALPEQARKGIPCELVSWNRFYRLSLQLARTIHVSRFHPDLIVAIARGGYLPARVLSDHLNVFDLAEMRIEHYHGTQRERCAHVRYPLMADVTGRHVLLVDDVSDSGDTFEVAVQHLRQRGEPAELRTAVLHHKKTSIFAPDYHAMEVAKWRWIIYPWAIVEDLGSFLHEMTPAPGSVNEFADYLREQHGIDVARSTLENVMAFASGHECRTVARQR